MAGLVNKPIADLVHDNDLAGLRNYVFDTVKPTFIHSWGPWAAGNGIALDPRLDRDYVLIYSSPDRGPPQRRLGAPRRGDGPGEAEGGPGLRGEDDPGGGGGPLRRPPGRLRRDDEAGPDDHDARADSRPSARQTELSHSAPVAAARHSGVVSAPRAWNVFAEGCSGSVRRHSSVASEPEVARVRADVDARAAPPAAPPAPGAGPSTDSRISVAGRLLTRLASSAATPAATSRSTRPADVGRTVAQHPAEDVLRDRLDHDRQAQHEQAQLRRRLRHQLPRLDLALRHRPRRRGSARPARRSTPARRDPSWPDRETRPASGPG